ncbi:hypothetical protein UFOVP1202_51 [uncultured Caudovirales phage]|uniref:Uncharacterized protein n=1 Tax=uncultured Caudovirales phage TaxID=2100421 RepID=A0A6J5R070_9CAUD|nr:hypothetical protein UFOVP1202_51 [uncultured Caudovirales phage]
MATLHTPRDPKVQAIFLRAHLRLISVGMTPPRGMTKGDILSKAGNITGNAYKRGEYAQAVKDLTLFIDTQNLGDLGPDVVYIGMD